MWKKWETSVFITPFLVLFLLISAVKDVVLTQELIWRQLKSPMSENWGDRFSSRWLMMWVVWFDYTNESLFYWQYWNAVQNQKVFSTSWTSSCPRVVPLSICDEKGRPFLLPTSTLGRLHQGRGILEVWIETRQGLSTGSSNHLLCHVMSMTMWCSFWMLLLCLRCR